MLLLVTPVHGQDADDSAAADSAASMASKETILVSARDEVYVPAFATLADSTTALASDIADYCGRMSAGELSDAASNEEGSSASERLIDRQALRSRFADAALAYSGIEYYRLGPMLRDNGAERLYYWPDHKGRARRQILQLLQDTGRLDEVADSLGKQSVALQGLGVIEQWLHADSMTDPEQPPADSLEAARCRLAMSVSAAIADLSGEMLTAWQADDGFGAALVGEIDSERFRNPTEALSAVLTNIDSGLGSIADRKLDAMISALERKSRLTTGTPFYASGLGFAMLDANIDAIRKLQLDSHFADASGLEDTLEFEYRNARTMIRVASETLAQGDVQTAIERLKATQDMLRSLADMTREDIAPQHGLTVGFNADDGD